jgi:hypothetical protein
MANATLEMAPMQWADMKDIDDVEPINEGDYDCLAELRECSGDTLVVVSAMGSWTG